MQDELNAYQQEIEDTRGVLKKNPFGIEASPRNLA